MVGGLARRILARHGHPAEVTTTGDIDRAVDGADAVLLQLRVGGQAARARDESWPLECGCVGQETTGAGGLAKALRTVPVVLDIAERVRRRSPDAWIIDFTNPVGIVTRALLEAGHRAVGLCNVAIHLQRTFADLLRVPPGQVHLDHYGLNHLTWELAVRTGGPDGPDVLPGLLAAHGGGIAERLRLPPEALTRLGVVPSYYLRYYYAHDAVVEEMRTRPSRASEVAAMEERLLEMYADPGLDEKPALLAERGGAFYSEAAVALAAALLGPDPDGGAPDAAGPAVARPDAPDGTAPGRSGPDPSATAGPAPAPVQVVNVRNAGTLPFLPDDAVVEVPARVTGGGAVPLPAPRVDPLFAGLIAHVSAYEELALDAALRGGRDRVLRTLLAHPLVGRYATAEALTDRLLAHNRDHLPWCR